MERRHSQGLATVAEEEKLAGSVDPRHPIPWCPRARATHLPSSQNQRDPPVWWRRGRDLNPRRGDKPLTRLAGERLRPLGHLSVRNSLVVQSNIRSSKGTRRGFVGRVALSDGSLECCCQNETLPRCDRGSADETGSPSRRPRPCRSVSDMLRAGRTGLDNTDSL